MTLIWRYVSVKTPGIQILRMDSQREIQYTPLFFRKDLYVSGKRVLFIAGLSNVSSLAGVILDIDPSVLFWLRVRKQRKGFKQLSNAGSSIKRKASKIELVFYQELP